MTEKKTYLMFLPGKTPDGKGTYVEHPLNFATSREEARVNAMGVVRALELTKMHLIENPGELVFYSWPMRAGG